LYSVVSALNASERLAAGEALCRELDDEHGAVRPLELVRTTSRGY
jgi:hypothetical protein